MYLIRNHIHNLVPSFQIWVLLSPNLTLRVIETETVVLKRSSFGVLNLVTSARNRKAVQNASCSCYPNWPIFIRKRRLSAKLLKYTQNLTLTIFTTTVGPDAKGVLNSRRSRKACTAYCIIWFAKCDSISVMSIKLSAKTRLERHFKRPSTVVRAYSVSVCFKQVSRHEVSMITSAHFEKWFNS